MLEMRTSERASLKSCAQQWYWSQVEGLRPNVSATPLWFGFAVHEGLAGWYIPGTKRGEHPATTFERVLKGERKTIVRNEEDEAVWVDAMALGLDMLNRYVEFYGEEPNKDYIAPEYKGAVILSRPERQVFGVVQPEMKRWLRYHFTWDGVYRDLDTDEVWLDEHKTAASIWHEFLPLDDQAGSYWTFANKLLVKRGVLKPSESIAGINYNFLRKAMGDDRPMNADGMRLNKATKKEHYISAIEAELERLRSGKISAKMKKVLEAAELDGKETMNQLAMVADILEIEVHGDVSATQPGPYFERFPVYRSRGERATMIRRIQEEGLFAEAYREGWLPITKAPSLMKCRFCPFRRICELDEQGDAEAVQDVIETMFHYEDPYEVYKKSAE